MLAFPLSMALMVDDTFPFALPGLVHVVNQISVYRPVGVDEKVDVEVSALNLRAHSKGRQFDVIERVSVAGEAVWDSVSTYLKRGQGDESAPNR